MMRTLAPVAPGEMLEEEFLKPLGLTKYRLAKDIGVPPQCIAHWRDRCGEVSHHC